jgi:hypothetical protein
MKGFGVFVDFASSTGNQTKTRINRCPVSGKTSAARPGSNLFLVISLINGQQWNVRNLILLILWFCTLKFTTAICKLKNQALALGHWPGSVAPPVMTRSGHKPQGLGWQVLHLSTGSDCNLWDKHVLPNRPGNVEVGGTGVLIKWPASIPGDSERTQISG